jgi:hypothetical protein
MEKKKEVLKRTDDLRAAVVQASYSAKSYDEIAVQFGLEPEFLAKWLFDDEKLRDETKGCHQATEGRLVSMTINALAIAVTGQETIKDFIENGRIIKTERTLVKPAIKDLLALLEKIGDNKWQKDGATEGSEVNRLFVQYYKESEAIAANDE